MGDLCDCSYGRQIFDFHCEWTKIETGEEGSTAVEQYKKSMKLNKTYDVIIMRDICTYKNGKGAAKELRSLGFTGFLICTALIYLTEIKAEYIESGVDRVVNGDMGIDDAIELREGSWAFSSHSILSDFHLSVDLFRLVQTQDLEGP